MAAETMTAAEARRARAREEMREQIVATARAAVAQVGVAGLSMRAIARSIGYSPAALYEYFPSKEDVLQAIYFEGAGGLAGRMQAALDALPATASASERLQALGHAYREAALGQPETYRFVFGDAEAGFTPNEFNQQCGLEAFELLVATVAAGIETGEFAPADPLAAAVSAWALVHGFVMLEIGGKLNTPHNTMPLSRADYDALFAAALANLSFGIVRRT